MIAAEIDMEVRLLDIQPQVLFAGLTAVTIIVVVGLGTGLAASIYFTDRAIRIAAARGAESMANRAASGGAAAAVLSPPAPTTQFIASHGRINASPSLGLHNDKFGMWIFLASEVMFFTALIATFVFFKLRGTLITPEELNIPLTAVNTFLLLMSSLTVVLALDTIKQDQKLAFRTWLVATAVLGAMFVGIQGYEWTSLMNAGVTPTSAMFGTVFFVLTGFHGLHVIIGVLWVLLVLARNTLGHFSGLTSMGFELFGLYWHFVDIVWIVLFTIIYLI